VYIINRIPSTVLNNRSPFEILFGRKASISNKRVLGCLCFATNLVRGDKFGPRAIRSVFLGYAPTQKGYKLYNIEKMSIFVSRDVVFHEDAYHFQHITEDFRAFPQTTYTVNNDCMVSFVDSRGDDSLETAHRGDDSLETAHIDTEANALIHGMHATSSSIPSNAEEGTISVSEIQSSAIENEASVMGQNEAPLVCDQRKYGRTTGPPI